MVMYVIAHANLSRNPTHPVMFSLPVYRPFESLTKQKFDANDWQDIVRTLKTMADMDARTDAGERQVAATLKRLADRLPACTQELCASEVCVCVCVCIKVSSPSSLISPHQK